MARIAIIRPLYRMTITTAQLCGELVKAGHEPLVIMFKRQEMVDIADIHSDEYQQGDVPMRTYMVSSEGLSLKESSIWKVPKPNEWANLVKSLREFAPDAIGVTSLSHSMILTEQITAQLRQHFDVPVLWGGTGPTLEPERSIEHADLVCVGEGEDVLLEIAERLDQKKSLQDIHGTWFRQADGTVQRNPKRPVSDLEKIAMPVWDERYYQFINGPFFIRNFRPDTKLEDKSYQIMTQRGCPFSCSFCVESVYQRDFGKKGSLRRMSPEKAIAELKVAKAQGYHSVTFMDDVFTVNPRWLSEFLPRYKEEIGLPFFCYTYPTTHDANMIRMLVDAGCRAMAMGVQSGSERILTDVYQRPTHIDRVVRAAEDIVQGGVLMATFDMIPKTRFDNEDDLRNTFELLLRIPKEMDSSFYAEMAYFPNYPIQEKFQDASLLAVSGNLTEDIYAYYFKMFALTRTGMTAEEIRAIYNDARYKNDHNLLNAFLPKAEEQKMLSYGLLIDRSFAMEKEATRRAL